MKIFLLFLFLLYSFSFLGQSFQAEYNIIQTIDIPKKDNKVFTTTLTYEGHLFKTGGKHIFYLRPLYLTAYPKGVISGSDDPKTFFSYSLVMDSIQQISYNDTDSLIFRMSVENIISSVTRDYYVRKFELGVHEWDLLNEKKIIKGLECQRGKIYRDKDKTELVWDIWFCPDISINFGPFYTRDLPGLIVEAQFFGNRNTYLCELLSYNSSDKIDTDVFWPAVFSRAKFEELPPLKRKISNPQESKKIKNY